MSAFNGNNDHRNNHVNRNIRPRKFPSNKPESSAARDGNPKNPRLSREERGQNLQYRSINMQKYESMLDIAKDNFADIVISNRETEECTICCKSSDLFGIGLCRHPVCVECAIRIRVLSNNRQCPVCRANMETLWFVFVSSDFSKLPLPSRPPRHPDESRYELRFENGAAVSRYEKYLAHVCKLCKSSDGSRLEFPTFVALRHHMLSVHQLTYCHICTENIIQFSRERKTYTRDGLQRHIRAGDRDDKSLKGHPSCLFCDQRFFDEEFRYRHLRKEHFFCQFCESEGKHMNVFFKDYAELVGHYKELHFICEFEECKAMGIAFSNQIDLNLHKSKEHSKHRVGVGIDFQFSDRQLAGPSRTRREPAANLPPPARRDKIALVPQEQSLAPKRNADEFVVVPSAQSTSRTALRYSIAPAYTPQNEDFPSLAPTLSNSSSDPALTCFRPNDFPRLNRVNTPGGKQATTDANHVAPSASSYCGVTQPSSRQQQNTLAKQHKSCSSAEDFPALPAPNQQPPATSAWGKKNLAKNFKSVVVGCKVPKNRKQLPEPDMWPDRPMTTPAREPEPEQWHEIPIKPRKLDKKKEKTQPKALNSDNFDTVEEFGRSTEDQQQANSLSVKELKVAVVSPKNRRAEVVFEQKASRKEILGNGKSNSEKLQQEPVVKNPTKSSLSTELSRSLGSSEPTHTKDSEEGNGDISRVEKCPEGSTKKDLSPSEAPPKPSSILDWFSRSSKTSIFANLSLANVLGKEDQKDSTTVSLSSGLGNKESSQPAVATTAIVNPSSITGDVPPGLTASMQDDVLAGPPPGFEDFYSDPVAPPGFSSPSTSQSFFSMAPFISNADLSTRSMTSEAAKRDNEWSTVDAK